MNNNKEDESKYIQYLPGIYQPGEKDKRPIFLGKFLKAFEKILSRRDDGIAVKGIEEILDNIQIYFDPYKTPLDFLPWLAGWMALTLKEEEEWNANDSKKKRDLIARIIPLYQKRGTMEGLEKYIRIYVGEDVKISINEFLEPFCVGVTSTVGMNTVVGEGRPYYFQVYMELPLPDRVLLEKKKRAIIDIIDMEKPAHTYYLLLIRVPTMQINVYSTIGKNTMLGGLIIGKNSV
jgi:phage tail-like protein